MKLVREIKDYGKKFKKFSRRLSLSSLPLKAEWRHIFTSRPMFLLTILAIIGIPMMYVGFFLAGYWDPYGQTDRIPVAVVNQDEGATLNGVNINIGTQIVNQLKDNQQLKWEFVSESTAQNGIQTGEYFMKIVIPQNMSQKAASISSTNPEPAVLKYETTPGKNFIVSLISKQAMNSLTDNIKNSITHAYASTAIDLLTELNSGLKNAALGAAELNDGAQAALSGTQQLSVGSQELLKGSQTLNQGLITLETSLPSSTQIEELKSGFKDYQAATAQLDQALNNATINQSLSDAQKTITELDQLIKKLQENLEQIENYNLTDLIAKLKVHVDDSSLSNNEKQTLLLMITQLETKVQSIQPVIDAAIAELLHELASAQNKVAGLENTLNEVPRLQAAAAQLNSSFGLLKSNTLTALDGFPKIGQAVGQLQSGSNLLTQKLALVKNGSNQLANGLGQLQDGSGQLAQKLGAASRQISLQPMSEKTAQQLTNPVSSQLSELGNVPNYGYGLSPYIMSLALLVGPILLSTLYPIRRLFARAKNGWQAWLAKASVYLTIALLQALVVGFLTIWILGLEPVNLVYYFLALLATAICNMSIVITLSILFNDIGRFLSLLLLVIQLGGSGGTFPVLLSSNFFQMLSPFMPMTHSIDALRSAIFGGMPASSFANNLTFLIIVALIFNFILIISLKFFQSRIMSLKAA